MKLLCLSTIDWNFLWQRHHVFMKQFAEAGWEIYFIENTGFRNPSWRDLSRLVKGLRERLRPEGQRPAGQGNAVPAGMQIVSPWVLPPNGLLFRWLNRHFFIPRLMRRLHLLGLEQPDLAVVYLPTETTLQILKLAKPQRVVYDCVANFSGHPQCPRDFVATEQCLLGQADLVLTDSDFLFRQMQRKHQRVEQLHQGVDVRLFGQDASGQEHSSEYRSVCFFGAIDDRIDWGVLRALQDAGAEVTLIGTAKVPVPPGIEVRGPFGYERLAEEVQRYDAFLLPYRINQFTDGIIPAKIFECMATGKPVLTAPLPSLKRYEDSLYTCRTPEEYVQAFRSLPQRETAERRCRRLEVAKEQSIERNFRQLQEILEEVMGS